MGLFQSMAGTVRLELTSADVTAALRTVNELGIAVKEVQTDGELTVRFTVSRRSVGSIEKMAARKGERVKILSRNGLFWPLWSLRHRPVLVFGMLLLLFLSLWMPGRVLFVRVEGNSSVPEQFILDAAQDSGICFGASRREVRSEKMKNALLAAVPQLRWAGVNTYGCVAVISVSERAPEPQAQGRYAVSNIVASCDGVITSCTVTDGSGLCSVGQAVQKGQVLISGYTDCGRTVTATRARGEIFGQTNHDLQVVTPSETRLRGQLRKQQTNFSLLLGKKRINFVKGSGIYDGSCVKMYSKYCLTLPGGFELPVALIRETVCIYDVQANTRNADEAAAQMSAFAKHYLSERLVALTITDAHEKLTEEAGCFRLTGDYACTEMIGREYGEQIGDFHGKTN